MFVLLNKPEQQVGYFIVPGAVLLDQSERFSHDFQHPTMPCIPPKLLKDFRELANLRERNFLSAFA